MNSKNRLERWAATDTTADTIAEVERTTAALRAKNIADRAELQDFADKCSKSGGGTVPDEVIRQHMDAYYRAIGELDSRP